MRGAGEFGLADVLNGEFDKHRDDIQKAAEKLLPCDTIRAEVGGQWHAFSIKIERVGQPPLFMNLEPRTAGFSGLIAEEDRIKIVVRLGVQTVLSTSAAAIVPIDLPPLDPATADQGNLDLNLQAVAPYDFLKNELTTAFKGKVFKKDTPAGAVSVQINDVDIFPSNGSLAVGLKIDANLPGHWFDTKGWVYLSGKATPVHNGKAVSIQNIAFATVIDSEFWKVAQNLFETEILTALKKNAQFDLSKEIDKAATDITAAIAKADVPGLKVSAGAPTIQLTDVHVGPDNLVATARLEMNFNVEVTSPLVQ